MSVVLPKPPSQLYQVVLAVFEDLWPGGADGVAPYPYAVHVIDDDATLDDLIASVACGWRYNVPNRVHPGYADIVLGPGRPTFGGLVLDDRAVAMSRAIDLSLEASLGGNHEGRVVDVPSMGLSALWLMDGTKSSFIPHVDGDRAIPPSVLNADEFFGMLGRKLVACRPGP